MTATPQPTEWSSVVFSQGSGRNMPHWDLIIYQHNVGFKPMRHQYIFLWSLTYCLLLSMLFSWLADKITVAVSKITSNSSGEGRCLDWFILQSLSSFSLGVEGESQSELRVWASDSHGPCPGISPWQSYSRKRLANSWQLGYKQTCATRSSARFHDVLAVFGSLLFGEP